MSSLPSLGALPSLPCTLVLMLWPPTNMPSPESVSSNTAKGRVPWLPCLNTGRLPPPGAPPPIVTRSAELRALSPLGRLLDDLPAPDVSTRPKMACATGRRRGRQAHMTAHSPSTTVKIQGTAIRTFGGLAEDSSCDWEWTRVDSPVRSPSFPPALSWNRKIKRIALMNETLEVKSAKSGATFSHHDSTHNMPSRKIPAKPIFCEDPMRRREISYAGRAMMAQSVKILGTALPMKNLLLSMQ